MMERLRNRDLRANTKCYTMFFDDDQNKDTTNKTSMPAKREKKTKSPRKHEPIKNVVAETSVEKVDVTEMEKNDGNKKPTDSEENVVDDKSDEKNLKNPFELTVNSKSEDKENAECVAGTIDATDAPKTNNNSDKNETKPTTTTSTVIATVPTEPAENERKRKRTISGDNGNECDDGDAKDIVDDVEYHLCNNKKLKIDSFREQMFKVRLILFT